MPNKRTCPVFFLSRFLPPGEDHAQQTYLSPFLALAGRPLRMISAAVSEAAVYDGYSNDNEHRILTTAVSNWVNGRQMYFDMHTIWTDVNEATAAAHRLRGTGGVDPPPWTPPNFAVALEWRPKVAAGTWHDDNQDTYDQFHKTSGCGDPPAFTYWNDFVVNWREELFAGDPTFGDSFGMAIVVEALHDAGFTVACYGQTWMQSQPSFVYDMATFLANRVCEEYTDRLSTECVDEYNNNIGDDYLIDPFSPHNTPCPQCQ